MLFRSLSRRVAVLSATWRAVAIPTAAQTAALPGVYAPALPGSAEAAGPTAAAPVLSVQAVRAAGEIRLAEGGLVVLPRARRHVVGTAGAGRPSQVDQVPTRRTASRAKLLTVGTGPDVQVEMLSAISPTG